MSVQSSSNSPPTDVSSMSGLQMVGKKRAARRFAIWFVLVIAVIGWGIFNVSSSRLVQAELALGRKLYNEALSLSNQELKSNPGSNRALLVAGMACFESRSYNASRPFLIRVTDQDPSLYFQAQSKLARLAISSGQVAEAEDRLNSALSISPADAEMQDQRLFLMTLEMRFQEARSLAIQRIMSGFPTYNYLMVLGRQNPLLDPKDQFAKKSLATDPTAAYPRVLVAYQALRDHHWELAISRLNAVLEDYPQLLEAHALRLQILADEGSIEQFQQAVKQLPANASAQPDIWAAKGTWCERFKNQEGAARCFWEAVQRYPHHGMACYRLSQCMVALKQPEWGRPYGVRSEQLSNLATLLESLPKEMEIEKLPAVVQQLEDLERFWEAAGWCHYVLSEAGIQAKLGPLAPWARSTLTRIYPRLFQSTSKADAGANSAAKVDLSHYELPSFETWQPNRSVAPSSAKLSGSITFRDDAERTGISFTYSNGGLGDDLESMMEMDGGGIAVLDYDNDFWPDLYFTQGGRLPPSAFDPSRNDRLFRNRSKAGDSDVQREFQDVTEFARLKDLGYGQGVTAGDYDNDGFQDLYVANIGQNQFYRNNGDGTFTEISSSISQPSVWSSSCVITDLNQDSWPDLYVVTYLGGQEFYKPCSKRVGPRCGPPKYTAEPDRFYLNLGDGTFRDLTGQCGLEAPEGRGLGVVAADFGDSRRLSLFITNDMTPNFYFHNLTESKELPRFEEQGLMLGLALDHMGRAKSGMGIAAGDYNRDGRLDLLTTDFYRASSNLFCQQPDGTYRDVSREAHLLHPSFWKLGWGAQFFDADLDGELDLIVSNGHVHDPIEADVPYEMEPQFFRNQGDSTFLELSGLQLGEYFQKKWHGRSLARLDWNRDGLEDACISKLNQPVSLLTNLTENHGHFLAIRIVAVDSARDAIGTKIKVTIGDQSWFAQLTAGDGFQASNERRIAFGLGDFTTSDMVEILWPSGSRQEFHQVKNDREWLLIEHRPLIEVSDTGR